MLKARKWLNFPAPLLFEAPARGNPLECQDEIWHQKTRIVGLPDGEEIMTLAFFVLTQYRRVTNGRTDTLRSLLPPLTTGEKFIALRRHRRLQGHRGHEPTTANHELHRTSGDRRADKCPYHDTSGPKIRVEIGAFAVS